MSKLPSKHSKNEVVILRITSTLKKELNELSKKSKYNSVSAFIRALIESESRK
ncbi:ribbon-helix-helix protein, CopG family [Psychroflexus sp. YR1-1]|uniref:Ribbon-helix-helix protein, CopG family n=1 Tax=Psychroflexus aurantiacus TaxID=2709310 RepID=A0A6B3R9A0_9FLAO|nr:ribbon-helix-helix protein, CopG family [Psychroflexus aurantiacus]NEV94171.1 ribbon-helix-helix protein, CopG family [Psychroflexus aurantiacus]